jgi:rubrerythrin
MISLRALESAEQLELLAAELYRLAAARFSTDAEAKSLFERLHAEEMQHAYRIRTLRSQSSKDSKLARGLALDPVRLGEALRLGEEAKDQIRQALSLAGALAHLLSLEKAFCLAHAETVTAEADPRLQSFFAALARQDTEHCRLLEEAAAESSSQDETPR